MDLVDRYIHAVARHLPAAQQDDIATELRDDIVSQIRDQEAALGRPLTEAEQEAVLKPYGHPFLLAMRYRPRQHLIGPALFPFYWPTLKTALAIAFGVRVLVAIGTSLAQGEAHRIIPRVMGFPGVAIQTFGWITLAFAAFEFSQTRLRLLDNWSPRTLPAVTRPRPAVNRRALLGELAGSVLFLIWWLAVPSYPFLMFGPGASFLSLSPAWNHIYLISTLPALTSILMLTITLVAPSWRVLARVRPLVVNVATLVVLSMLLKAGDLLAPVAPAPEAAAMVRGLNNGIHLVLGIISIIVVLQTVYEIIRLVNTPPTENGSGRRAPG